MGPGPNRMCDATVIQTTQGLLKYLDAVLGEEETRRRGVVIGYDHRARPEFGCSSKSFARQAACVFLAAGVPVHLYDRIVATPLVPFAVDELEAAAGIMVTASHNPKGDNGYKLYWGNGAQIIPPHDANIAKCIEASLEPSNAALYGHTSRDAPDTPEAAAGEAAEAGGAWVYAHALRRRLGDEMVAAYIARIRERLCRHHDENGSTAPITYTAMHGVGTPFVQAAFEACGLPAPVIVERQCSPDPTFPTVEYPNPEEGAGALQLSMAAAEAAGSTIILANDPDADRLAVAERNAETGEWHVFSGNQIGALLGAWMWRCWQEQQADAGGADGTAAAAAGEQKEPYMLATAVSSAMLGAMAKQDGFGFDQTLTGFKWLGNRAQDLRDAGHPVIFTMEQAIGFCCGDVVKDKDGVSAACVFAEMAGQLAREGKTPMQQLEHLYETYGHFVTSDGYVFVDNMEITDRVFARLRNGGHYWHKLGRFVVSGVRDLTVPTVCDTTREDGKPTLPVGSAHMITLWFANQAVLTLRPSGTEPKLKYYTEMNAADPEVAKAQLAELVKAVVDEIIQPKKNV